MRTCMAACSIHSRKRAWTSCIGGERKVRVVKPGSSEHSASARQRAMTSCSITIPGTCYIRTARAAEERDNGRPYPQFQNEWPPRPEMAAQAVASPWHENNRLREIPIRTCPCSRSGQRRGRPDQSKKFSEGGANPRETHTGPPLL